jgi:hypothetical protein
MGVRLAPDGKDKEFGLFATGFATERGGTITRSMAYLTQRTSQDRQKTMDEQ